MLNLSAFLKNSILASSVFATFSMSAMAAGVSMTPFPKTNPPEWLASDLITPWHLNSGAVPALKCGTVYMGMLDASNSSNVQIQTMGCNGNNPVIINAMPINGGWSVYQGSIYKRSVDITNNTNDPSSVKHYDVAQVFADSQFLPPSHYPETNDESAWLQYNWDPSNRPNYSPYSDFKFPYSGLPSSDIKGAQLTFRGWNNPYNIATRTVSDYSSGVITLAPTGDYDLPSEDPGSVSRFYLEGKLWMLTNSKTNQAGWAYDSSSHTLYVRMPDGQSPDGRIYAGPYTRRTIDARGSNGVTVKNVRVVGGDIGIDGGWSDTAVAPDGTKGTAAIDLHVYNDEINYSNFAAIYATHTVRLNMAYSKVIGALHSGVYARNDSTSGRFTSNEFDYVGNVAMHKGGVAAIYVNNDGDLQVVDNTFNQIGKTAIWTGNSTNAVVSGNKIYGACIIHGDCGGIYLFSRANADLSHTPLYTRVHDNVVQGVTGTVGMRIGGDPNNLERYAIYLDDYTDNAYIYSNSITGNATGMQIHHGINNYIMDNTFSGNSQRHVLIANSSGDADGSGIGSNNYFGIGPNISNFSGLHGNTFVGSVQAFWIITDTLSAASSTASFNGNIYQGYSSSSSIGSPSLNYK